MRPDQASIRGRSSKRISGWKKEESFARRPDLCFRIHEPKFGQNAPEFNSLSSAGNKSVTLPSQPVGVKTKLFIQTLQGGLKKSFGLGAALVLFGSAHPAHAAS